MPLRRPPGPRAGRGLRWAVGVGATVLVAAAAGCTSTQDDAGPTSPAPATTGLATAPAGGVTPGAAVTPGSGPATSPATGSGAAAASPQPSPRSTSKAAPRPTPTRTADGEQTPGQGPTRPTLGELLASQAGTTPTPPPGPSLTGPAPKAASARGKLVKGFPSKVVPVPSGLTIVSSSVSGQGVHVHARLEASSDAKPSKVVAAYRSRLEDKGFVAATAPAVAGSSATSFTRGVDGIVVTVRPRLGGGTELVVSASLTTAR